MVMALLAVAALLLAAAAASLDGTAAMGPREVDPAYFFAGDVPTTGSASIPATSPRWPICVRCAGSTRAAC